LRIKLTELHFLELNSLTNTVYIWKTYMTKVMLAQCSILTWQSFIRTCHF